MLESQIRYIKFDKDNNQKLAKTVFWSLFFQNLTEKILEIFVTGVDGIFLFVLVSVFEKPE